MRRSLYSIVILTAVSCFLPRFADAKDPGPALWDLHPNGTVPDGVTRPAPARAEGDTIWYGNDDGNGYAVEGGVWDFEGDGGAGALQGWTSRDLTANLDDYFGRVSEADFSADPCNPMMNLPDSEWQIWCGIHEEDANLLDYIDGMGYGNDFCQSAFSPLFPVGDVSIEFSYFNETELDWDYTYLYILCFDGEGEPSNWGPQLVDRFTGQIGSPDTPANWSGGLTQAELPPGTEQVQFEIRFTSDGAWSDEDGLYDCACGPFAADNISLDVAGSPTHFADFEEGEDGYTFGRCEGVGAFMGLVDETTYTEWLEYLQVDCECTLSGWALEFVDESTPYTYPGHPSGQHERGISGIVDRDSRLLPPYSATLVRWDNFVYLRQTYGCFYRQGYMYYPYTTEVNPDPHWSQRLGQNTHYYTGDDPSCGLIGTNLSTLDGQAGTPLSNSWEQMRFVYDVYCSCVYFGIPSTVCNEEGNTHGSPVLDNVRVGLIGGSDDLPRISSLFVGIQYHDGYGQTTPTYLSPLDVGNSNVTYALSSTEPTSNSWHADTSGVAGAVVHEEEDRFLVEMCYRVVSKGPMQDLIPRYLEWRARLPGDPEEGFVCSLMDSVETSQGAYAHKFLSYYHEDDPAFDEGYPDRCTRQEILPDSIWTPGTQIEYYYRAYWYDGGVPPTEYYYYPSTPMEFEILPRMRRIPGDDFEIQWPAVLYVDAFNRGAEFYVAPAFDAAGLDYDKYDYLDASSCCNCPLPRSYGGTHYNPGGYGNNGLTIEQALGYRMMLLDTGSFGAGACEEEDWTFFHDWLSNTACGVLGTRRGLLFAGSGIAQILDDEAPTGQTLLQDDLGATLVHPSFRLHSGYDGWCVYLEPTAEAIYVPGLPLTVHGNGCPAQRNFDVMGLSGAEGAVGNLNYGDGGSEWPFASVVRDRVVPGETNWRSVISGFSPYQMSYEGCAGATCSGDSACVVDAGTAFLEAAVDWMTDGAEPFELWSWACGPADIDGETHLAGQVTHLFAARPNPFHRSAAIRFSLAGDTRVQLRVFDVTGRQVCELIDADLVGGQEHEVTWDGTDDGGRPVGAGLFWMQLSTANGYRSSRRLIVMR